MEIQLNDDSFYRIAVATGFKRPNTSEQCGYINLTMAKCILEALLQASITFFLLKVHLKNSEVCDPSRFLFTFLLLQEVMLFT